MYVSEEEHPYDESSMIRLRILIRNLTWLAEQFQNKFKVINNLFLSYAVENPEKGVSDIPSQQIRQHHDMNIMEHCVLNIAIGQVFP